VLTHPELRRITRCIVPGCPAALVGRKSGRYCAEHGSAKARAMRCVEKLTPEERRERRRKLYLQWNRINRPEHYRELLDIEAARKAETPLRVPLQPTQPIPSEAVNDEPVVQLETPAPVAISKPGLPGG
jgi:hypothetical protein